MIEVTTTRLYRTTNGSSSGNFVLHANTESGKITYFDINYKTTPSIAYIRLLAKELTILANEIEKVEKL